jgi:hypothetical protein
MRTTTMMIMTAMANLARERVALARTTKVISR